MSRQSSWQWRAPDSRYCLSCEPLIESDGSVHAADCANAPFLGMLDELAPNALSGTIIPCAVQRCSKATATSFATLQEAEDRLNSHKPLRNIRLNAQGRLSAAALARLSFLETGSPPQLDFEKIALAQSVFASPAHGNLYLQLLKCLFYGKGEPWPDCQNTPTWQNCVQARLKNGRLLLKTATQQIECATVDVALLASHADYKRLLLASDEDNADVLESARESIAVLQPEIRIEMRRPAQFLQYPLWLRENFPNLKVEIFAAKPQLAILRAVPPNRRQRKCGVKATVVIAGGAGLVDTTLSCLLQTIPCEVVAVCAPDVLKDLRQLAAVHANIMAFPAAKDASFGAMLNAGLDLANGEYILFARAGQLLASNFLASALTDNCDVSTALTTGGRSRAELALGGMAFRAGHLLAHNLRFAPRDHFCCQLFAISALLKAKTVALFQGICPQALTPAQDDNWLADFSAFVAKIEELASNREANAFFTEFLRNHGDEFASACANASPTDQTLRNFCAAPQFVRALLCHCAACLPAPEQILQIAEENAAKPARGHCQPFANADAPVASPPKLSVILPNYNKRPWLADSLASIFSQSMPDFELIVIDDCSTDGSFELLKAYAACDARMRLYWMTENSLPGACRNEGLALARAPFVIFADSDDICQPDYFRRAVAAMEADNAAAVFFASEKCDPDGRIEWRNSLPDSILDSLAALGAFFKNELEPAPWAKIFRASAIRKSGAHFPEGIYHQDVHFLLHFLKMPARIACSSFMACRHRTTPDSCLRPRKLAHLHIHSAFYLYAAIAEAACFYYGDAALKEKAQEASGHIRWNLETILLPKCAAFLQNTGQIPSDAIAAPLLRPLFIRALLAHAAQTIAASENVEPEPLPQAQAPVISLLPHSNAAAIELAATCALADAEILLPEKPDLAAANLMARDGRVIHGNANVARGKYVLGAPEPLSQTEILQALTALEACPEAPIAIFVRGTAAPADTIAGDELALRIAAGDIDARAPRLARREILADSPQGFAPLAPDLQALLAFATAPAIVIARAMNPATGACDRGLEDALLLAAALAQTAQGEQLLPDFLGKELPRLARRNRQQLNAANTLPLPPNLPSAFWRAILTDWAHRQGSQSPPAGKAIQFDEIAGGSLADEPFFSILLVARNAVNATRASVESILAQCADFELIFVDNGSDAGDAWQFCRHIAFANEQIRFFRARGDANEAALAFAAQQACGKYLLVLQPGDILQPNFLECARSIIERENMGDLLAFRKGSGASSISLPWRTALAQMRALPNPLRGFACKRAFAEALPFTLAAGAEIFLVAAAARACTVCVASLPVGEQARTTGASGPALRLEELKKLDAWLRELNEEPEAIEAEIAGIFRRNIAIFAPGARPAPEEPDLLAGNARLAGDLLLAYLRILAGEKD